jgi:hypothetical protein
LTYRPLPVASRPSTTYRTSFAFRPYWGLRDFEVPATVWGGEPHRRHRWGSRERGRRKDMRPADTITRKARVGLNRHQDSAATNGGRFCERWGAWLGSLGLESSPGLFVTHMVELLRDVRRVLKPTGSLWLNLGDTFYGGGRSRRGASHGLKPKDLEGRWATTMRSLAQWTDGSPGSTPRPSLSGRGPCCQGSGSRGRCASRLEIPSPSMISRVLIHASLISASTLRWT